MDALQVFVRGFETREAGDKIIDALDRLCFQVTEQFDGSCADRGGIIETAITPCGQLETDDLNEILDAVAVTSDTFIQYSRYELMDDGELHVDAKVEESKPTGMNNKQ